MNEITLRIPIQLARGRLLSKTTDARGRLVATFSDSIPDDPVPVEATAPYASSESFQLDSATYIVSNVELDTSRKGYSWIIEATLTRPKGCIAYLVAICEINKTFPSVVDAHISSCSAYQLGGSPKITALDVLHARGADFASARKNLLSILRDDVLGRPFRWIVPFLPVADCDEAGGIAEVQ